MTARAVTLVRLGARVVRRGVQGYIEARRYPIRARRAGPRSDLGVDRYTHTHKQAHPRKRTHLHEQCTHNPTRTPTHVFSRRTTRIEQHAQTHSRLCRHTPTHASPLAARAQTRRAAQPHRPAVRTACGPARHAPYLAWARFYYDVRSAPVAFNKTLTSQQSRPAGHRRNSRRRRDPHGARSAVQEKLLSLSGWVASRERNAWAWSRRPQ